MRGASLTGRLAKGELAPRRKDFGERAPGYVREQSPWAISNELLASAGTLALVCIVLIGPIGVLAFIGSTGLLVLQQPQRNLGQVLRFAPFLLIPILAMVSAQWSPAPASTMRSGLQLLLTFVAVIVIARNVRPERMILVMLIGFAIICLTALPNVPASLARGIPLSTQTLGSKNQVAFSGFMLATLSLALMIDPAQPRLARLLAIPAVPLALVLIVLAQSGGGSGSLIIAAIVFFALAALRWLNIGGRVAVLIFALGVLGIAIAFLPDIEAAVSAFRSGTLNKDATLTGRTYLWEFADRLSAERPWLGLGYGAFWRQGNIDAEGLWRWAGIPNRSGFNFHNSFVGMRVELGRIGEGLLYLTCAVIAIAGMVRQFMRPTVAMACLLSLLVAAYVRSYVEEGLVAAFSPVTFTWLAAMVYAFAPNIETVRTGLAANRERKVL